jgi:hypothetical protein
MLSMKPFKYDLNETFSRCFQLDEIFKYDLKYQFLKMIPMKPFKDDLKNNFKKDCMRSF